MKKRLAARAGASLMEILITFVIVSVLAVLGAGAIGRVRAVSKDAKCISNLRATGGAMIAHAAENGGVIDSFRGGNNTTGIWTVYLLPEVKKEGKQVFRCPAWSSANHDWSAYGMNMFDPEGEAYNPSQQNPNQPDHTRYRKRLSTVAHPSRYILFADTYRNANGGQIFRISDNRVASGEGIHLRHGGRVHVFFLDGHIGRHGVHDIGQYQPQMVSGYDIDKKTVQFTPW